MGQMIAPMIEQMTPSGQSIPFTMGDAVERLGKPILTYLSCMMCGLRVLY